MSTPELGMLEKLRWRIALTEQWFTHGVIAGLSVLALCILVILYSVEPLRLMNSETAESLQLLEARRLQLIQTRSRADVGSTRSYEQVLPSVDKKNEQLDVLFGILTKQGVSLEKADYKSELVVGSHVEKFNVSIMMVGDISSQRRLIELIQSRFENAALSAISYDRERGSDTRFSSKMEINFYYSLDGVKK